MKKYNLRNEDTIYESTNNKVVAVEHVPVENPLNLACTTPEQLSRISEELGTDNSETEDKTESTYDEKEQDPKYTTDPENITERFDKTIDRNIDNHAEHAIDKNVPRLEPKEEFVSTPRLDSSTDSSKTNHKSSEGSKNSSGPQYSSSFEEESQQSVQESAASADGEMSNKGD